MSPALLLTISIFTKLVLAILGALSFWSIAIIWERKKFFEALDSSESFASVKEKIIKNQYTSLSSGFRSGVVQAALNANAINTEQATHAIQSYLTLERVHLEKNFTTLATLGSNAPFIGLFGTVLGIIHAFGVLSNSSADTSAVMSGISEALIATAVGLFVAIPALIAYNVFTRKLRVLLSECDSIKELYLSQIK